MNSKEYYIAEIAPKIENNKKLSQENRVFRLLWNEHNNTVANYRFVTEMQPMIIRYTERVRELRLKGLDIETINDKGNFSYRLRN